MLTLKAIFSNGEVSFIDPVPFSDRHEVFVTFLPNNNEITNELKSIVRDKGRILSERELEVLRLYQGGSKSREIAQILKITPGTVRNHLTKIYKELRVQNKSEAIQKAIHLGFITPYENLSY